MFCSKNASTNGTVVADEIRCPEKLIVKGGKNSARWTCLPCNFLLFHRYCTKSKYSNKFKFFTYIPNDINDSTQWHSSHQHIVHSARGSTSRQGSWLWGAASYCMFLGSIIGASARMLSRKNDSRNVELPLCLVIIKQVLS